VAWAKFDDSFYDHPKIMQVLEEEPMAMVLFVRAATYCARHLTDGCLRRNVIESLVPLQRDREVQVKALIDAGLLYDHEGRFYIHDYLDYNPSRDETAEKRERDRVRKEEARKRQNG
jgi:hypothetical protein